MYPQLTEEYDHEQGKSHSLSEQPMTPDERISPPPQYACAIIVDSAGKLLLELRPETARLAAGLLACFGGRREAPESAEECLRRELREELDWEPDTVEKRLELRVNGERIAWFFQAQLDVPLSRLRVQPGSEARLVSMDELSTLPVSPWHRAALAAWSNGISIVEIDDSVTVHSRGTGSFLPR